MANISGLLGTAGGFKGTGVSGPDETQFVNSRQTNDAYNNVQNSMAQQNAFLAALNGQNALGNQNQVYGQLQGVVNGQGPNPAMAMLNQATGNNIANQGAMMAGQRGASGNVGMMARLAAQQGANTQQQAIGQGASLQAQQGLNALTSAGNMANTQVSNLMGQTNQNVQSQQGTQANLLGGALQGQQAMNNNRTQLIGGTAQQQAAVGGGAMSGAGSAMAMMAGGGDVSPPVVAPMAAPQPMSTNGPQSMLGKSLAGMGNSMGSQDPLTQGMTDLGKGIGTYVSNHKSQPSMPTTQGPMMAGGAGDMPMGETMNASKGGPVPGTPNVNRDSYANDTVPAKLSPGEIVLPLHITQSPNAPEMAAQFVRDTLAKKMAGGGMAGNYAGGGVAGIKTPDYASEDVNNMNFPAASQGDQRPTAFEENFPNFNQKAGAWFNPQSPMSSDMPGQAQPMSQTQPAAPTESNDGLFPKTHPPTTKTQDQSSMPNGYNPTQGYDTQMAGINKQADVESQLAQKNADIYAGQNQDLANLTNRIEQNTFNHDVEVQNIVNDMKEDKIDPDNYMNHKNGFQKVPTAIGLILGGIGGGLTGQGNAALAYLNGQIQRDVEAQKNNMDKKNTLLGALEKQYGNKQDALKMAHAIYSTRIENQLKEEAAKLGTPAAQARAMQAIGPLQTEKAKMLRDVGLNTAVMEGMAGGDPQKTIQALRVLAPDKAKDMEARMVPGIGFAYTPDGAKGLREMQTAVADVNSGISRLRAITKMEGKSLSPTLRAEANTIRQMLVGALRVPITGPGSMSEGERNLLLQIIPGVTDFTSYDARSLKKLDTIESKFNNSYANMLKANGLKAPATQNLKPMVTRASSNK